MAPVTTEEKKFWYPPGGILIWIVILIELITFGAGLIVFAIFNNREPALFHQSRQELSKITGIIYTLLLLTSGFFIKKTLVFFKQNRKKDATIFLKATILSGLFFVLLKFSEYYQKFKEGIGFDTNSFYNLYWLLTGFHLVHVIAGLLILSYFNHQFHKKVSNFKTEDLEAGAAFWHLCDLIWLMLFPVLYLMI